MLPEVEVANARVSVAVVLLIATMAVALGWLGRRWRRDPEARRRWPLLVVMALAGAVAGQFAHLWFDERLDARTVRALFHGDCYGWSFLATFATTMMAGLVVARLQGADFVRSWGAPMSVAALGSDVIARIGCFLEGCCFGTPSGMPWAVRLDQGGHLPPELVGVPLHPVQLYESLGCLGLLVASTRLWRRGAARAATMVGLIGYLLLRLLLEEYRWRPRREVLDSAQIFCVIGIVLFSIMLHDRRAPSNLGHQLGIDRAHRDRRSAARAQQCATKIGKARASWATRRPAARLPTR